MRTQNIQDVLDVVQAMRKGFQDRQFFRGFSGPARAASGTLALIAAGCMSLPWFPEGAAAHLLGWGAVLLSAAFINGFALMYWFFTDDRIERDIRRLRPALDVLTPLFVGAGLTLCFIVQRNPQPLFGIWMCMFGLSNLAARTTLPSAIAIPGVFYILSGFLCLAFTQNNFLNPWPMGIVFFAGEWISGLILYIDRRRFDALDQMLNPSMETP